MAFALRVLLPLPLEAFDFLPPFTLKTEKTTELTEQDNWLGKRVIVPWQNSIRIGIVTAVVEVATSDMLNLREVIGTLDEIPFLAKNALELLTQIHAHTHVPTGIFLRDLLPVGLTDSLEHHLRLSTGINSIEDEHLRQELQPLADGDWHPAAILNPKKLDFLRQQGLLLEQVTVPPKQIQVLKPLKKADDALLGKPQRNQKVALDYLHRVGSTKSAAALARAVSVTASSVSTLIKKGYAGYSTMPAPAPALPNYPAQTLPAPAINPLLPEALNAKKVSISGGLRQQRLATLLPVLAHWISQDSSVLVLVPENYLIHETVAALTAAVPVLPLSGELSPLQRHEIWDRLRPAEHNPDKNHPDKNQTRENQQATNTARAAATVLVGTSLALLAPLPRLGAIVILEAGSPSYKLMNASQSYVPTLATMLAEVGNCPLWFSDALVSPELLYEYEKQTDSGANSVHLFYLPYPEPRAHVVNLSNSQNYPLSADLIKVLKQVEARARQAIVLVPRRGYSAALRCTNCQNIVTASHCECMLPLRYLASKQRLRCHQCGYTQAVPAACPSCQHDTLEPAKTAGTEWIMRYLEQMLPNIPIKQYDNDKKDDLSNLAAGEPAIIVGTTAIFRHAPLPKVSLIALTFLDAVFSANFRSEEDAYRALLNLPELAPKHRPLIVVQTYQPDHPVLETWTGKREHDTFVTEMLERRQRYSYPPYGIVSLIQVSARKSSNATQASSFIAAAIRTLGATPEELIGPMPAPLPYVRGMNHEHLILHTHSHARLETLLQPAIDYRGAAKVRWDVEPRNLLDLLEPNT